MAGTSNIDLKTKQLKKRKRVARMKKTIVYTITLWMLLSIVTMIFLVFKIFALQKQIYILMESREVDNEVTAVSDVVINEENFNTVNSKENLAEEGDIPMVYLTFDDGPSANSNRILDILDDYDVKATFFVVGKNDEESKAVYKRIVDEGHTIGMHSYTHSYADIYASTESFEKDLNRIQTLIKNTTGVNSQFYRFPGGSSNRVADADMSEFATILNEQGITYFDWNVSSGDATSSAFTAKELVDNVMGDVVKYKTSVVLLHDATNKGNTVEALPDMIESLREIGAMILPISEDTRLVQHMSIN